MYFEVLKYLKIYLKISSLGNVSLTHVLLEVYCLILSILGFFSSYLCVTDF